MKFGLALMVALAACSQLTPDEQAKAAARRVADAYMKARGLHREGGPERPVSITDEGPHRVVTYHVPEGWAGGSSYVSVDKRTMRVVDFIGTQ